MLILRTIFLKVMTVPKQDKLIHEAVVFLLLNVFKGEAEHRRIIFCKAHRVTQMMRKVTIPPISVYLVEYHTQ